ncbi:hypothetical protein B0I32_105415 [Nonomuraea fuscirosea]|uniref:Uncharacterized protein n=1 Tax=Nonomuraea fuscirosea TaxID=1291556 RepID=A0A2T0N483_9ACTN|nr:hypothetical protein [Nonomuraea fuscirosea]PRX66975.1 hypothetical protein B0I32_105415 [Nonomuraea fuscirosea]
MAPMTMVLDTDGGRTEADGESITVRPASEATGARALPDAPGSPAHERIVLLTGGMGVIEEELLHRALVPLGPVHAVPRMAAAIAAVIRPGGAESTWLVCDAGENAFTVALADAHDGLIRPVSVVTEPRLGRWAFVEAVTAATGAETGAEMGRALREGGVRLAAVIRQAMRHDYVRDEAVVAGATAGLVLDTFTAFAERIKALLPSCPGAEIILIGGFADFPPVRQAIADGACREPRTLDVAAIARGACDVAEGRISVAATHEQVALPLHRTRAGLLEEVAVPVPAGLGQFAQLDDRPLVLSNRGTLVAGPTLPERLPLLVGDERCRAGLAGLPPGDYRVGVRGAPIGLLLDREAADPILIPVERQT